MRLEDVRFAISTILYRYYTKQNRYSGGKKEIKTPQHINDGKITTVKVPITPSNADRLFKTNSLSD